MDGSSAEPPQKEAEPEADAPEAPTPPMPLVDRVKLVRDVFYIVALFIAGIWAVATFAYHSWYLPKHELPIVSARVTLTELGESDGKVAINAHLVLRNEGNVLQHTWALSFYASGCKVLSGPGVDGGWRHDAIGSTWFEGSKEFDAGDCTLLASSVDLMTQPGRTNPVLPHSEEAFDFHFFVDRATADLVKLNYDVLHPVRDDLPEQDWFTLKRGENNRVEIDPTDACKREPRCAYQQVHTSDVAFMSLWPHGTIRAPMTEAAPAKGR
jgi:hypothetical protein